MKEIEIFTERSLRHYFYSELSDLNKKLHYLVPEQTVFYISNVMEHYGLSSNLFEKKEGRLKHKVLGMKLLQAASCNFEEQKRIYQDIGDTALIVCGYFSDSVNGQLVDKNYYINLGQTAYDRMNNLSPEVLDIPSFYRLMASYFKNMTILINTFQKKFKSNKESSLLLKPFESAS